MQMPRLRNVLMLKNSLVSSSSAATQFASIHSSRTLCQKWKNKWSFDVKGVQQPSKNYIQYAKRRKCADAKKALKDLLYKGGPSKFSLQDERLRKIGGHSDNSQKTQTSNSYARDADKSHQKKIKRKFRRESFVDDFDDHPKTTFRATFGNRCYTWSFNFRHDTSFQDSTFGFKWREQSSWKNKSERWQAGSNEESDDKPSNTTVGSSSDRTILGLPLTGPLRIEDVKKAFHLSALKWHPDKHQGPSQAMAEEKFKLCVNAYKSLCSALSPA